ncbi:MAG: Zinc carboxypeptidase [Lentisphaerae bacterium ADurb.Bin242]|nr:MAG: Zinc carboxypeptidase [Lentisphaerae bacterium ADurb.Bin242]
MKSFKPYEIHLEKRPEWWKVRLPEIKEQLKLVQKGRVETILRSKEISAVYYNEKEYPPPKVRWPTAAGSGNPDSFKTSGYEPQGVMIIAGVHGAEPEGVAAVLNLLQLLETGKDLRGKERPFLLDLLNRYRLTLIPCCNPDGRKLSPDHMKGVSPEEFHRISQGVWLDGSTIGWAKSKEFFPLPLDKVSFPGGYPNRDGYNIMHDCAPGKLYTGEAKAILALAEKCQPDLFLNLHSQEHESILCRPGTFDYAGNIRRGNELSELNWAAFRNAGFPASVPKGSSQSLNLNTAAVMLTGTLAMTYESTTDCGLSFDQLLESHYLMLETVLADGLRKRFAPRNER